MDVRGRQTGRHSSADGASRVCRSGAAACAACSGGGRGEGQLLAEPLELLQLLVLLLQLHLLLLQLHLLLLREGGRVRLSSLLLAGRREQVRRQRLRDRQSVQGVWLLPSIILLQQ
jgi:hypothetical protein